jgi:hypothetical protein
MRTTRILLTAGLVAPLFVVVMLVDGALQPGYDALHRFGSELSNGPFGWIQIANFLVTGVALLAFAVGLRRLMPAGRGRTAAPILAGVCGAGLVLAGLFTMDPSAGFPVGVTPPAEPTLHGQIHGYAPFAVFLSTAALAFVLARRFTGSWRWLSLAAGVLVLVTFVATPMAYDFATQTGHYHGLWQRAGLVVGFGYLAAVAVRAIRAQQVVAVAGARR